MLQQRLSATWMRWLTLSMLLWLVKGRAGGRPTAAVSHHADADGLARPMEAGQDASRSAYSRRMLLMSQPEGAGAAVLAPEASAVGMMWAPQAEEMVAQLAAGGLRLTPSEEQQQQAIDALVARAEALAHEVIVATRDDIAALAAQVTASIPEGTSPEAMATLIQTTEFSAKLKAAVDAAVLLVTGALEPHLPAVAEAVHSTLNKLVVDPPSLEPLPAFSDSFLPAFVDGFSVNVVEATLLQSLWQDS